MPNTYLRKTERGMASIEIYDLAFEEVTVRGESLRSAASSYNLNYMSLQRYIKKKKAHQQQLTDEAPSVGYISPTVFTKDEEKILCDYLLTCAASNYGLTTKETRSLAYLLAKNPASASTVCRPLATQSNIFSPETIRPLPKAPPRKGRQQNRRKVKSAVLTDTPVKDDIAAIEESRKAKNVKKRIFTDKNAKKPMGKKPNKKSKTKSIHDEEEDANDGTENEYFCLCCLESFANSRPNEEWVQCINCKGWSHEDCTGGELQYECYNCLSD